MYPTPFSCLLWIASRMSSRWVNSPSMRLPPTPPPYNSSTGGSLRLGRFVLPIVCLPECLDLLHLPLGEVSDAGELLLEVVLHMGWVLVNDRRNQPHVHEQIENRPCCLLNLLPLKWHPCPPSASCRSCRYSGSRV